MAFDLPRVEYNHDKGKTVDEEEMTDIEKREWGEENNRQMLAYIERVKGEKISLTEYLNGE